MERRSLSRSVMEGDDGGAGAGNRLLDLPLPLAGQMRRADDQNPLEARHVRGAGRDEGLAGAHLPDDGGAPVGFEGEGRAPDGVRLRPQGGAQQHRELAAVLRGLVEGRVGLHHPLGDGVAVCVDESCQVHAFLLLLCKGVLRLLSRSSQKGEAPPLPMRGMEGPRVRLRASRLCGLGDSLPSLGGVVAAAPDVVGPCRGGHGPSVDDVHRCGLHGGFPGAAGARPLAPVALDKAAQQEGAPHAAGLAILGARERIILFTRLNWALDVFARMQ